MAKYTVRYVHKIATSTKDVGPDVEIANGAFSDSKSLGKALRAAGVLASGSRVENFRVEGDKTIIFPWLPGSTTYWHAVVLGPVPAHKKASAPDFTPAAHEAIAETGGDYGTDLHSLRTGALTPEALLAACLEGADPDRETGWKEYVSALVSVVASEAS